eukprot:scaffold426_cov319-Pavlova_lutheri.AAC.2
MGRGGGRERGYAAAVQKNLKDARGKGKDKERRGTCDVEKQRAEERQERANKSLHPNLDDVEPRERTQGEGMYDAVKGDILDHQKDERRKGAPEGSVNEHGSPRNKKESMSKDEQGKRTGMDAPEHVHNKPELPRRPGKPPCTFYLRMGTCKYGATCKFDHPDLQNMATPGHLWKAYPYNMANMQAIVPGSYPNVSMPFVPPTTHAGSSEGNAALSNGHAYESSPVEPSETSATSSPTQGHATTTSQGTQEYGIPVHAMSYQYGGMMPMSYANMFPYMYTQAGGMAPHAYMYGEASPYPVRADAPDCTYYMKTGHCRFGATCKFNHPPERLAQLSTTSEGGVSLNSLGLPMRPGAAECSYYMKTRTCKFGRTCKFHHPELMSYLSAMLPSGHGVPMYSQHLMYPHTGGHLSTGTVPSHGVGMLSSGSSVLPPTAG